MSTDFWDLIEEYPDIEERYIQEWLDDDEAQSINLQDYADSREIEDYGLDDDELPDDYDGDAF